jgi:hypothetical protein
MDPENARRNHCMQLRDPLFAPQAALRAHECRAVAMATTHILMGIVHEINRPSDLG